MREQTSFNSESHRTPHPQVTVLFGAAYYEEYTPTDRLEEDIAMMKAAHITVVRIAESTWATEEPEEGHFDFSHIDRVLNAMDKAGIKVIVGTPTYALPGVACAQASGCPCNYRGGT